MDTMIISASTKASKFIYCQHFFIFIQQNKAIAKLTLPLSA